MRFAPAAPPCATTSIPTACRDTSGRSSTCTSAPVNRVVCAKPRSNKPPKDSARRIFVRSVRGRSIHQAASRTPRIRRSFHLARLVVPGDDLHVAVALRQLAQLVTEAGELALLVGA